MYKSVLLVLCLVATSCSMHIDVCKPNTCGEGAKCVTAKKVGTEARPSVCVCEPGYEGDPWKKCERRLPKGSSCAESSDCPEQQACSNNVCVNPCAPFGVSVCGIDAACEVYKTRVAVCSCREHFTGDPFVKCEPFSNIVA